MIISKSFFDTIDPGEESLRKKLVIADKASGVNVWLVDGKAVREQYNEDFIGGGHHYVYDFIPLPDVWLEDTIVKNERGFFLTHELHERRRMASGMEYQKAHNEASAVEQEARKLPQNLGKILKEEFSLQVPNDNPMSTTSASYLRFRKRFQPV